MVGLSRVTICLAKMSAPRYCCTMAASWSVAAARSSARRAGSTDSMMRKAFFGIVGQGRALARRASSSSGRWHRHRRDSTARLPTWASSSSSPSGRKRIAALGNAEAECHRRMASMSSPPTGKRVRKRHRVVDVHRRRDGAHRIALQHPLQQVLDGTARSLLRLELLVGVAPYAPPPRSREIVLLVQVLIGRAVGLAPVASRWRPRPRRATSFSRLHVAQPRRCRSEPRRGTAPKTTLPSRTAS